ncbi:MAG TPA: SAF domain-containing protein [Anaerolineae bacterium]|nr:SAF domain-containing protein [Anaerolineae bacterium]HQM13823.1 SAF domain-containing protein [Anaerolineae bacterium]
MRTNRTVILVLMLLLLVVAAGAYFLMRPRNAQTPTGEVTVTEPPYQETIEIVVAAQNIPRGERLSVENLAVVLQPWPKDALPLEYFDSLEQVDQKFARMDIPRGMPITPGMLGQPGGMLSVEGSAAALFESGRVAYTIPMDTQGAVGWAPMPGDRVHILAAIQLLSVDPEFQSPLPNKFLSLPATEEQQLSGDYGRFEALPNGQDAFIYQSGPSIPNLVVQMTVQNALVWRIGTWNEPAVPVTAAAGEEQASGLLGTAPQEAATPIATPIMRGDIEPVTLLVYPQDALVLKYLLEMGADLDLVLCSAADSGPVITEPVWLRYVLDKYQISDQPSDLPVAATPVHPPLTLPTVAPTAPAN